VSVLAVHGNPSGQAHLLAEKYRQEALDVCPVKRGIKLLQKLFGKIM
jgi:translation initiation factor 2B subunit (eIF-2B alpha/beta/delta family)